MSTYCITHEHKTRFHPQKTQLPSRQIVGFSLPPALAVEVKVEAARRNVALCKLFDELWALYKNKKTTGEAKHAGQSR